jgi:hypothetical protein
MGVSSASLVEPMSRVTPPSVRPASTRPASVLVLPSTAASPVPPSRGVVEDTTHSPAWQVSPLGQSRVSGPVSQESRHWPPRQYMPDGQVMPAQSSAVQ